MEPDRLSGTLKALADPTRRALLQQLAQGEATVGELAAPHRLTLAAISKHLGVLARVGMVRQTRRAQWRACRLDAAPILEVAEYLQRYRQQGEESLSRLDAVALKLSQGEDG